MRSLFHIQFIALFTRSVVSLVYAGGFVVASSEFIAALLRVYMHRVGQWHCSQVSLDGRRLCTGVSMGREYEPIMTANTWRAPDIFARANQSAPCTIVERFL